MSRSLALQAFSRTLTIITICMEQNKSRENEHVLIVLILQTLSIPVISCEINFSSYVSAIYSDPTKYKKGRVQGGGKLQREQKLII